MSQKPLVSISYVGTRSLGRCYNEVKYRISSNKRLSSDSIVKIYNSGVMSRGQSFEIISQCDGNETPAGRHNVPAVMVDDRTGEILSDPPVNWAGIPVEPRVENYWDYDVTVSIDSGD